MWFSDFISPIAFSNWDDVELGVGQGAFDGSLHFLVAFLAQAHVGLAVAYDHVGFEAGTLARAGHFLDGFELHDLVKGLIKKGKRGKGNGEI
jgi:hypothetical protein